MNYLASTSKETLFNDNEEEDVFEDSSLFRNFENVVFRDITSRDPTNNINDSINNSVLNVSALCCDEEISGYDKLTGRTWIYPTNYPIRDYQFNIIKAVILKNTLVSLPTGLGKTFIAAVIMYNFYRWYPLGKIIFTAPTRPLVAQQIDACYNISAIPPNDTIEMTGGMQANTRKIHWKSKRVFFATPQVIYNDIKSGICPGEQIRCLVFDEAHKARGNYAYCQIISSLDDSGHKTYRVLALSATPGSKIDDVVKVVKNLHIAHLELRTENCIDVAPYNHARQINTVIINLGVELTQLRQQYVEILDRYARNLKQLNILPHNVGNISKGRMVMLYKEYQSKDRGARHPQHNRIMKDFTLLIALYHGLELLVQHGSRVFLNFFDEHPEKTWIQSDDELTMLLERLRDDLGINPMSLNRSMLPDGTIPELPKNLQFGHPKFNRLKEIILEHFNRCKEKGQDTRAIVFCEYRESVNLVHCLLLQCRPLILPQMFVGQGTTGKAVISQKQQLRVMRNFREGACNVLVATCVAEEGLDVGSVDLILCFDISTRSPIRLVQRCGRTGRERGGRVYILVTEGREHQTLLDCMRQRDGLNKKVLQSKEIENNLYKLNPRMMPHDHMPECQKMFITATKKPEPIEKNNKSKKGQKDLRAMLLDRTSSSGKNAKKDVSADLISKEEFEVVFPDGFCDKPYFQDAKEYFVLDKDSVKSKIRVDRNLTSWLEWQRTLQPTINIAHSCDTKILSELLQYSDAKRFELPPSTQNPNYCTQALSTQNLKIPSPVKQKGPKKKQKIISTASPIKRDGDIRALFSTALKSTKSYTKVINDLGIKNDGSIPTSLIDLLVDMTVETINPETKCLMCENIINCNIIKTLKTKRRDKVNKPLSFLINPVLPDISLLNKIDSRSIQDYVFDKKNKSRKLDLSPINDIYINPQTCNDEKESNIDVEHEIDSIADFNLDFDFKSSDRPKEKSVDLSKNSVKNFDVGDIEDIFNINTPEEVVIQPNNNLDAPRETLGFFGLDSIDDIFADSDDSIQSIKSKDIETEIKSNNISRKEAPLSPSILSGSLKINSKLSTSPILGSQRQKLISQNSNRISNSFTTLNTAKQLYQNASKNGLHDRSVEVGRESEQLTAKRNNVVDSNNSKSMLSITQLLEIINSSDNDNSHTVNKSTHGCASSADTAINSCVDDVARSSSPILLTQAERKVQQKEHEKSNRNKIVIPDSDSDLDDTVQYDVEKDNSVHNNKSPILDIFHFGKRKASESDEIAGSPYFAKRPRLNEDQQKTATLQEKLKSLLVQKKHNMDKIKNTDRDVSYLFTTLPLSPNKENLNPVVKQNYHKDNNEISAKGESQKSENELLISMNLEKLQIFRRENKLTSISQNQTFNSSNAPILNQRGKAKRNISIMFDDSDDDFEDDKMSRKFTKNIKSSPFIKRKTKRKANEFLDVEAALSKSGEFGSGDEISDGDSIGSIIDFICDDVLSQEDNNMQAQYLHSVKNTGNGVFKIPQLPRDCGNVFSQVVIENDSYEMDSFCVDSNIGLTQVNDISELELAEMRLEAERKARKKVKCKRQLMSSEPDNSTSESPLILKNRRNKKTNRIMSDSDDSS